MIASSDYSIYSNDIAMIGMIDLDIVMIASLDLDKSFRCNLILLPSGLSEQFNSNFFLEDSTRQRNFQSQYQLKVIYQQYHCGQKA